MVLNIYTKNASNLAIRYWDKVPDGQKKADGRRHNYIPLIWLYQRIKILQPSCGAIVLLLLVGLILYVQVNSYGHVGTVGSPNQTFFLDKLD